MSIEIKQFMNPLYPYFFRGEIKETTIKDINNMSEDIVELEELGFLGTIKEITNNINESVFYKLTFILFLPFAYLRAKQVANYFKKYYPEEFI